MHKPFCIILLVVITPSVWTKTKWSKEIPDPESHLTRERRQFNLGDWIPLTQPCLTCRPLTDPADTGRIQDDIGLTPPRPPTVTRQIHKTSFFPQDESSILSVPPPPVFNRNQIPSSSTRFQNFFQQFNNPNSLQFDTQPVFPQTQFLPQTFLGSSSLLGSNYPQVLPLLNNPSALLVQGNVNSAQEIKTQKINHEAKVPNLQDNVILEQNRQQQHPVSAPSPGLELPLPNEAVNFAPHHQQQTSLIEGNILTPPPVPNSTIPDVIIPGLDKEEIQLLYVPLETLRQRSQQLEQQQKRITLSPQNVEFSHQQQSGRPTERPTTSQPIGHFITYSATPATPTVGSSFQPFPVTPSTLFFQHLPFQGTQTPLISATPETPTLQTFVTPSTLTHKFSSFPTVTPTENLITTPEKVRLTQEFLTTPKTLTDQLPVKDVLGKELNLEELHKINKLKSVSIQNHEEQEKNVLLQKQKEQEKQKLLSEERERERLKQQKLQREQEEIEGKQKLLRKQQEREKQQKLLQEQQERDRQQKLLREQQERERYQKLLREQKERERQQKLFREQQERERQEKLYREQQERERQEKLYREQQERERQEKLYREQQERERQEKLYREQQERERQEKLFREQQERERQEKLYREQQERERQEKLYREQQERERQEKLYREQKERERQEKLYREQQERERQEKLYREQQERERQEKLFREQQERERQEKLYREEQEKLFREQQEKEQQHKLLIEQQEKERQQKYIYEQQERERQQQLLFEQQEKERQEKLLLEEKQQKELLIKEQQERKQQLLLQEQQDRERQLLLNQQQEFLLQQQIAQTLPTQFDFQSQTEATATTHYEQQTETQDASLIPHQPPLSIFYGSSKPQPRISDLLKELRGTKTIPVLDQYLEIIPKFFVGPADMNPPKGYGKFDLPYLSNIDVSRVERKVNKLPFFVAPLNFIPPHGYSKIPFPAPHIGSVVVSSETTLRPFDKGSTPSPYLSSVRSTSSPKLQLSTQSPSTSYVQQISPKLIQKEIRRPNEILASPQFINDVKTESVITTVMPETTTQARTRRPFYRTKVRRPTTVGTLQATRRPENIDNSQLQKTETTEKKPNVKFPKRGRQRTKSTTENPELDSLDSANRQYLIETSPANTVKTFESEILKGEHIRDGTDKEIVQGIFEVDNSEKRKVEQSNTDATTEVYTSPKSPPSTAGFDIGDNTGFSVTSQRPSFPSSGVYELIQGTVSTINSDGNGKTNYFHTTQRQPSSVEIENIGHTGFYEETLRIPIGIESNGDSGFNNKPAFTSTGADSLHTTAKNTEEQIIPDFKNYENAYSQEISKTEYDSREGDRIHEHKQLSAEFLENGNVNSHEKSKGDEVVHSTPEGTVYETSNPVNEQPTESVMQSSTFASKKVKDNVAQDDREDDGRNEEYQRGHTPSIVRIKSRIRSKSRGQVNYANSQTTTPNPFVRKRVAYKNRKEESAVSEGDEVRLVPKYRGQKKTYLTSTEASAEPEKVKNSHIAKPHRRTGVSAIVRRRKPTTSLPETTPQSQTSPQNYDTEYSLSGVSNEVLDDQIRESTQSRRQYSQNVITFTTTTTTELPVTTEIYSRRRDEAVEEQATTKAKYEDVERYSSEAISEFSKVAPTAAGWEKEAGDEELKKYQDSKKAFDPSLEKKNARRRIRVRVHKRPHEHFEAAESQNLGTVANALVPPTSAKPSSEPDLYRFSKTGFNFDQSEKFAGTKNQAHVRNITSDILENTATFSAPGVENEGDLKKVTIVAEEKHPTTTESATETTELNEGEDANEEKHVTEEGSVEERTDETTTENGTEEVTTIFTTVENFETETETSTTEELTRETQMSTATEISHETEICFRGRCVKTNSETADDDLRKLVQSADKILKT